MIGWIKNNWKIITGTVVVGLLIWWLCCCESKPAEVTPAVEEAPVKAVPLTDEEIEKIF